MLKIGAPEAGTKGYLSRGEAVRLRRPESKKFKVKWTKKYYKGYYKLGHLKPGSWNKRIFIQGPPSRRQLYWARKNTLLKYKFLVVSY